MRSLVVNQQAEWLVLVSLVQIFDSMVGDKVGSIAHLLLVVAIITCRCESWVIILSLIVQHMIIIEAFRSARHMPFAHNCSLVASILQHLWKEGLCGVDTFCQLALTILVAIQTCHQTSTTWSREWVFNESLVKLHTSFCKSVDIWCRSKFRYWTTICANGLHSMVVTHYI